MRISAGQLKGRKIDLKKAPSRGDMGNLRPTSAKVREALFDILRNDIRGSSFLDLYAGTSAIRNLHLVLDEVLATGLQPGSEWGSQAVDY